MSASTQRSLSVVLPVYQCRSQLPELHRRLTLAMQGLVSDYTLIFVEDGGDDGSLEWLRERREQDPRLQLVEQGRNGGQHRAIVAGLCQTRTDLVVVMDADLQDPPEAIPRLVHALGDQPAVVFARRAARFESFGRQLTGRMFKRFLRLLSGSRVPADTGTFFATTGLIARAAADLAPDAPYVPLLLDRTGCPLHWIIVDKTTHAEGTSTYTARRRLRLAAQALADAIRWRFTRAKRRVS